MISEVMGLGGEGEIKKQGCCEVEDTVYVAVGQNLEEGKALLLLAVQSFAGKKICLLHVHLPNHYTQHLNKKLFSRRLKWQTDASYQDLEHREMHEVLNQFLLVLDQMGVVSGKVWSVTDNIEKGIVQIIAHHGVRLLVMGAAEKYYSKKSCMLESSKAFFVFQNAPASCEIWFPCKGYLINTRLLSLSSHIASIDMISHERNHGSVLPLANKEYSHNLQRSQSLKSKESYDHCEDTLSMVNSLTVRSMSKSQDWTSHPKGHTAILARSADDELVHIMSEAKNLKQRAFEESVRRWRAEEDAMEAMQLAKESESLCLEEKNRNKEMVELLVRQRQEPEILTDQHEQILKEYQTIQDQNPDLERKIAENSDLEDELEKKIIQAVTLLIKFKDKRDMLWIERDKAIESLTRLRKSLQEEATHLGFSRIFVPSFSDIVEATKNFDPSLKIGEGRLGTVYKGTIYHVDVAIKMLPFCGSLSDLEFKQKAEVLSRLRHPNLVTMYGVCIESRSLIYEYLENGSLADYLTGTYKIHPLPWQIRIRVMIEVCSVLIFLHNHKPAQVLGNLRPENILLDANFVSKLSDIGVHHLAPKAGHIDTSYLDPNISENGEYTTESDVYSFGILVLHLLTAKPASSVVKNVRYALEAGDLKGVLDYSGGDWPFKQAKELAMLALRCCEEKCKSRPDLVSEVWRIIEPMKDICGSCSSLQSTCSSSSLKSQGQHRVPSHFVCPILQEVMKDPCIAADGFTYEADAIKGWLESGHKTSPMTNLELEHCDLLPNYALYYAIQEWENQS